jgi:hypothetical protein
VLKKDRIDSALARLMDVFGNRPWVVSLGIGKVDSEEGVVVSVRRGTKGTAARMLNKRRLGVPVHLREVGPVRALPKAKGGSSGPRDSAAKLRRLAQKRLS